MGHDLIKSDLPFDATSFCRTMFINIELLWPSGYDLRLSLERSQVLILVKIIGG